MKVLYTKSYDNTFKNLKKHYKELSELNDILDLINNSTDFNELNNNPLAKLYDFEPLKYQLSEFYSFKLNNKVIRLIVRPVDNNLLELSYISYEHYKDFNKKKVIYYDE